MNKTTEALKMAIAFMETLTIDTGIKTWNEKHRKEAINACKEALESQERPMPKNCRPIEEVIAEYEQDPNMKKALDEARIRLREHMSQEQEPVAWTKQSELERVTTLRFPMAMWKNKYASIENNIPLYTHPAQPLTRDWIGTVLERADKDEEFRKGLIGELAQPLSDDEINEILVNHDLANVEVAGHYIDVVLLMRDVEQAHGIK